MLPLHILVALLAISTIPSSTIAEVPPDKTFKFVNQGQLSHGMVEYDAHYRSVRTVNHNFFSRPFSLCFYNTTPSAYVLAIRAGLPDDMDLMRWVWDANRDNPVGENATLSLGPDGNLVLAEADGRVKWQTKTANKGVTGIQLLPNGNLVLHDKKGEFVWQSFDHPTDTLLTGQSLRVGGANKLVSRKSDKDGSDGSYSVVLDKVFSMYVNRTGQPLLYGGWQDRDFYGSVTFDVRPEIKNLSVPGAYELVLTTGSPPPPPSTSPSSPSNGRRRLLQVRPIGNVNTVYLNKVNYNATTSFLRLGSDGTLKAYTYFDSAKYLKWEETFAFFATYFARRCGLPSWCGDYGYCDRGMCIACPTPEGIQGWNSNCSPPETTAFCGEKGKNVKYYKIVGVEHFLRPYVEEGEDAMDIGDCKAKCDSDCKCLGYFYSEETRKCVIAPFLGTLIRFKTTSIGYIKY